MTLCYRITSLTITETRFSGPDFFMRNIILMAAIGSAASLA